jgi:two-component system cell cycle sensor histidine kinase/response regulator CckA
MAPDDQANSNTKTILVVDDELEDRQQMRTSLEAASYRVLEASNYHSGVNIFAQHSHEIDLLIADISLPDTNGCELAKSILEIKPDLKVLLVSGHTGAEVCRFYGLTSLELHFLEKPFKPVDLLIRVYRVMLCAERFLISNGTAETRARESVAS